VEATKDLTGKLAAGSTGLERYPHVFQPLRLGPVEVENRIYMAPHGIPLEVPVPGYEAHHMPAAEHAHYFAERAAGGVGLIFHSTQLGVFASNPTLAASPGLPESVPSYRRVAELVHEQGAKIMAEIWYVAWHLKRWEALGPEAPSLAPSATQHYAFPGTRYRMRRADIRRLVHAHGDATLHLREAGYDGVELHVSHGAILEYFVSPYHNHRTDEYGGNPENRARILREALEVTREAAGEGMAVGIRLTVDQMLPGGRDLDATRELLEHLVATGLLDFVDLDITVEPEQAHLMTPSYFEPKLHNAERVAAISGAAGSIPVLATPGRLTNLADAERLLAGGSMQMVGAVRGLIADPELVSKAREGRERDTRVCIAANHCTGNLAPGGGFSCAINPTAGREERWGFRRWSPAPRTMRVVVVGAGPAGLEAARVAARRGHSVTLLEARPEAGGGLALWAGIPGREHLLTLRAWWLRQLDQLGVDLRTEVRADESEVLSHNPDVAIVATGSYYDRTGESGFAPRPIPGWEGDNVYCPEAVISRASVLSGNVLVLDEEGYNTAAGVAEIAARDGATVEYVTRKLVAAEALGRDARYVHQRLRATGVTISTLTYVTEIGERSVTLVDLPTGASRVVNADAVVLATMRKPVDELADALDGKVRYVYLIGDALSPRSLREATYEGHRFARVIGDDGMPATVTEELFRPLGSLRPAALA
jgi:2,4-dienoyl-CoA reductase-like NADH-dependent reductase (Old Yellow Enzyme family)/thioredoxin reductase